MARSVAGLFPDGESAERAIVDLKQNGFDPARIGVVMRDRGEARDVAAEHGARSTEGAVAGGIIGGTLGALLVAVGALAVPGVGPFISGGVLAALVGGAAGWLVGGLAALGIPESEARYYEDQVHEGRALVTVDAQGRDDEARAIMLRNGAEDMRNRGFGDQDAGSAPADTTSGYYAGPYSTAALAEQNAGPASNQAMATDTGTTGTPRAARDKEVRIPVREEESIADQDLAAEDQRIPVLAEQLVVEKQPVSRGMVRVHKGIETVEQTLDVPIYHEEAVIEHIKPEDYPAGEPADPDAILIPIYEEQVVVEKRSVLKEYVRIRKNRVTEQRTFTEPVRREYVEVIDGRENSGASD